MMEDMMKTQMDAMAGAVTDEKRQASKGVHRAQGHRQGGYVEVNH